MHSPVLEERVRARQADLRREARESALARAERPVELWPAPPTAVIRRRRLPRIVPAPWTIRH